jgi:uncharacterized membrane-anchored protein
MRGFKKLAAMRAALASALLMWASLPARADVFADVGTEVTSWVSTFDTSFFPVLVTIGLLIVVGTAFFNKAAAVILFITVVAVAIMYGTRDTIIGFGV